MPSSVAGHSAVANAELGFSAHFFMQLEESRAQTEPLLDLLSMTVNSLGASEEHSWTDDIADLVEFDDTLEYSALGLKGFTLENLTYARGVSVKLKDIEDDRLGHYIPRVRQLADRAAQHPMVLLRTLINGGFTTTHYDGVNFFSAAHPRSAGGTQSNLQTGALSDTTFDAAVAKLETLQGEESNNYLGLSATHLIVDPTNKKTAREIVNADYNSSGASNMNQGDAQVLVVKGLTAGYWAVADLSHMLKPFVRQKRMPVSFTAQDRPDDDGVFDQEIVKYKARYRGAMGYAFWQTMVASTG